MTTPIINTTNLTKVYRSGGRETRALDALTLDVQQGEIFGYLGPNGAGKTTTIKLLLDLIRPTTGSAAVFGMDARAQSIAIHRRIGFLPGELNLWKNRTAQQVAYYLASVRGGADTQLREAGNLAERLKLDMTKRVRDYSTGNKRKLGLVLALMHKPELLILDEPTSGLDPLMQQEFHQMMLEARSEGRTVFLSSHVLSEVQAICNRVGILGDGQLKAVESVERLMHAGFRHVAMQFREPVPTEWQAQIQAAGGSDVVVADKTITFKLYGDFDPVLRAVSSGYIADIRVTEPSLEEIFLTFYGNGSRTTHATKEAVQ
jgi:ABC-2 type transport system ATP-binding protein